MQASLFSCVHSFIAMTQVSKLSVHNNANATPAPRPHSNSHCASLLAALLSHWRHNCLVLFSCSVRATC